MSFTSSALLPAMKVGGGAITTMAKALGLIVGAGLIGASYQIAHDEGRGFIHGIRLRGAHRKQRNELLLLMFTNTELPVNILNQLLYERDVYTASRAMLVDETISETNRGIIHACLSRLQNAESRADDD